MKLNAQRRANLTKLADWLEANAPLLERRPELPGTILEPTEGSIGFFDLGLYAADHHGETCGTAGCAIGWASVAVEPRQTIHRMNDSGPLEDWMDFSVRLFGTNDVKCQAGEFMFGSHWDRDENTPKLTAERIRYVLEHVGNAPDEWGDQWTAGEPQNGSRIGEDDY